jgi:hypothetical protein
LNSQHYCFLAWMSLWEALHSRQPCTRVERPCDCEVNRTIQDACRNSRKQDGLTAPACRCSSFEAVGAALHARLRLFFREELQPDNPKRIP